MSGRVVGTCNGCGEEVWSDRDHSCSVPRLRSEVSALREALRDATETLRKIARDTSDDLTADVARDAVARAGARGAGNWGVEGNSKLPANSPRGSGGER